MRLLTTALTLLMRCVGYPVAAIGLAVAAVGTALFMAAEDLEGWR